MISKDLVETTHSRKQIYIEAVRGLAALLVVFTHFMMAFYPSAAYGAKYQAHGEWEKLFIQTPLSILLQGEFAVCLFFVLSGYVLSLPYFGPGSRDNNHLLAASIKRPFRLGGMVIFSELVAFALLYSFGFYNVEVSKVSFSNPWLYDNGSPIRSSLGQFLLDITTSPFAKGTLYNSPLWTIQLELYGSFLVFGLLLLFRKSAWRVLVYIAALVYFRNELYQAFIIGIIFCDVHQTGPKLVTRLKMPILIWPLLMAGLLAASYPHYAADGLAGTMYGHWPRLHGIGGGYSMIGATLIFAALLLNPALQEILSKPLFAFCGRISFSVYAMHFLLLGSFTSWLFLRLNGTLNYDISCIVCAAVSLASLLVIAYMVTRCVDEPVTRAANKIGKLWFRIREPAKAPAPVPVVAWHNRPDPTQPAAGRPATT
jgi:peptidoglycan/LPS O-acetylase OafA/YrhL